MTLRCVCCVEEVFNTPWGWAGRRDPVGRSRRYAARLPGVIVFDRADEELPCLAAQGRGQTASSDIPLPNTIAPASAEGVPLAHPAPRLRQFAVTSKAASANRLSRRTLAAFVQSLRR